MSNFGCGAPVFYDHANALISSSYPSTTHVHNTSIQWFFRRYLLQKALSVFAWKVPKTWSLNYMLYCLYCWGFVAIINTNKFGVIPQGCGLRGYDVMYQPTHAVIANPLLHGIKEPRIDVQCVLLRLQPDYGGIMDIVNYYADLLALCYESVSVNLLNSKLSYVFTAGNRASAEAFKKLYDKIASGEPAVVQDKTLLNDDGTPAWQAFEQNVGQNYIATDVLSDMRKIEAMYDTEIGIPNANTDKRERLITDEVNANNVETATRVDMWLAQLQEGCEKARKMFPGLELSVDWRVNPYETEATELTSEGGADDES